MTGEVALAVAAVVASSAGAATLRLVRAGPFPDPLARLGMWMAVGLSVIPLIFEFAPIAITTTVARLLFATILIAVLATARWRHARRRPAPWYAVAAVLLALVVGLAVAQTGGAMVAPGVDSVHHLMLTRLIVGLGGVPRDLEPFIAGGRLAYHWGTHANVAVVSLLMGRTDPLSVAQVAVWYAAFLRIVCCLTLYAAARSLFGRNAAIIAAAAAAGVSALPAALVTQGRFTQLAGVAVLPALIAVRPSGVRDARRAMISAILAAGVFLLQARLAVFAIAWIVLASLFAARRSRRALVHGAAACAVFAVLLLPWGLRLAREPLVRSMVSGEGFAQKENRWTQRYVPSQLTWLPNNGLLLSAATAGLSGIAGLGASDGGRVLSAIWCCIVVAAVVTGERRKREPRGRSARRKAAREAGHAPRAARGVPWRPFALLAIWTAVGALFLLLRPEGIDATNVVPYAAGILTAFIPILLAASGLVSAVTRALFPARRAVVTTAIVVACAVAGVAQASRYTVRSPVPAADLQAMEWIRRNVSPSARFAVMARPFYGIYVGEDAGYWIQVLTDRRSILPPMIYGWVSPLSEVSKTNALLKTWTTVHPNFSVPQLMAAGVTHAYIGSSAQQQTRDIMRSCSRFRLIYDRDGVLIAEMR